MDGWLQLLHRRSSSFVGASVMARPCSFSEETVWSLYIPQHETIMKPYAVAFYKSKAWKDCREAYARSKGGLCERCLKDGKYTAGEIVHHKVNLTPTNIHDPNVTLNWDNLELVCRLCHAAEHGKPKRYTIDAAGRVTIL